MPQKIKILTETDKDGNVILRVAPGEPGSAGERGPEGPQGLPGKDGQDGKDGKDGTDGPEGPAGPMGIQGPPGEPGKDGKDGKDGSDGQDGKDGSDGKDGENGTDGKNGLDGKDGERGPQGPLGPIGPEGPVGPPGESGKDGEDSPLSKIYNVLSNNIAILGEHEQEIFNHKFTDGFFIAILETKGYAADLSTASSSKTEYMFFVTNGEIRLLETKPVRSPFSFNDKIFSKVEFVGNQLIVKGTGTLSGETNWSTTLLIHK